MAPRFILIVLLFSSVGNAYSQCYFYNSYDYIQEDDDATSIMQTANGQFMSVGSSDVLGGGDGVYGVRIDDCGNVLWKSFDVLSPGSGGETPWAVFESPLNHSSTLFGAMYDSIEGSSSSFILKLSANGDSLYHKIINHGYNDWCKGAIKINENKYLLGGYFNVNPPDAKVFMSEVDSLGNIVWQHNYGDTNGASKFYNIQRANDNGYLIGGQYVYYDQSISDYKFDILIIKTDSLGNQEWQKRYRGINDEDVGAGYVINTSGGGYAIFSLVRVPSNSRDGYLIKTDSAGNIQWRNNYDYNGLNGYDIFNKAQQLNDGAFIVGGTLKENVGGYRARITKLSESGSLIWDKYYSYFGGSSHDYLWDLIITNEGDIVGNGNILPIGVSGNTQNDMFILKVDSCGYLDNSSLNADFTYQTVPLTDKANFTNQSTGYCTLYWDFGDGSSISYEQNPTHNFQKNGTYTVTLVARAGNSLDTITKTVVIPPRVRPWPFRERGLNLNIFVISDYVVKVMVTAKTEETNSTETSISQKELTTSFYGRLSIINMLGQEVFNQAVTIESSGTQIPLPEGLQPGIYLAILKNDETRLIERLVMVRE